MAVITIPNLQHLRKGIRSLARNRRRRLKRWLSAVSGTLDGTGTGQNFTADIADNQLDIAGHGHSSGDGPFAITTTGTLPGGLQADTLYWVSAVDADAIQLHFTRNDAVQGIRAAAISGSGSGTHTLTPATVDQAIVEHVRQGVSTNRIQDTSDIDDLI